MLFLCCSCTVISVGRELITEGTGVVGVQSSHIFWFTEFIFQNVIRFITLINWYFLLALVRILVWRSARLLIKVGQISHLRLNHLLRGIVGLSWIFILIFIGLGIDQIMISVTGGKLSSIVLFRHHYLILTSLFLWGTSFKRNSPFFGLNLLALFVDVESLLQVAVTLWHWSSEIRGQFLESTCALA
jgi:hypothetical protein